jgi:hypothetical protein
MDQDGLRNALAETSLLLLRMTDLKFPELNPGNPGLFLERRNLEPGLQITPAYPARY